MMPRKHSNQSNFEAIKPVIIHSCGNDNSLVRTTGAEYSRCVDQKSYLQVCLLYVTTCELSRNYSKSTIEERTGRYYFNDHIR